MTNIEWTDKTWNWLVGCSRISAGCKNCYAASAAKSARLQQFEQYKKVKNWDGTIEFVESQILKPLTWRKPQRIFTCSMADIFHESVPDEWIDKAFAVMAIAPRHTFQILTKRAERMKNYLDSAKQRVRFAGVDIVREMNLVPSLYEFDWPLPNVWVGVSVENRQAAIERIPPLRHTPAVIRFLSCEPLLEDLGEIFSVDGYVAQAMVDYWDREMCFPADVIDWVIAGGESGSQARLCRVKWLRSLAEQCRDVIPIFVKQMGSNSDIVSSRKSTNIEEFPEDLRIRQFPDSLYPSTEQVFDAECLSKVDVGSR